MTTQEGALLTSGTLTPAYGRDYKSKAEVIAAFEAGKDFEYYHPFAGGSYVSKADFAPGARIALRYKRLRSVALHTVQKIDREAAKL